MQRGVGGQCACPTRQTRALHMQEQIHTIRYNNYTQTCGTSRYIGNKHLYVCNALSSGATFQRLIFSVILSCSSTSRQPAISYRRLPHKVSYLFRSLPPGALRRAEKYLALPPLLVMYQQNKSKCHSPKRASLVVLGGKVHRYVPIATDNGYY